MSETHNSLSFIKLEEKKTPRYSIQIIFLLRKKEKTIQKEWCVADGEYLPKYVYPTILQSN